MVVVVAIVHVLGGLVLVIVVISLLVVWGCFVICVVDIACGLSARLFVSFPT